MKKKGINIISLFVAFFTFIIGAEAVNAADHKFSLETYTYESNQYSPVATVGDLVPGQLFRVGIYVETATPGTRSVQLQINYDPTLVTPVNSGGNAISSGTPRFQLGGANICNGNGVFPSMDEWDDLMCRAAGWTASPSPNVYGGNSVRIIASSNDIANPSSSLSGNGYFGFVGFKVLETATPGAIADFTWNTSYNTLANGATGVYTPLSKGIYGDKSSDNSLSSLVVKAGSNTLNLDPAFVSGSTTPNTFDIIVPNSVTDIDIEAVVNNEFALLPSSGIGNKILNVGDNEFTFTVTAQDLSIQIYTINVKRLSNDTSLSTLDLSGITGVNYNDTTKTYSVTVPYVTSSTNISATATHSEATTTGTGAWNLTNTGATANTKTITVKAEDCLAKYSSVPLNTCTSTDYTIIVNRISPSTDALLSNLTVNGTTVANFSPSDLTYTLPDVTNATTKITVGATLQDDKGQITTTLGDKNLIVGDNSIEIITLAEDGVTTKTYTINVRRLSNDANLSALSITSAPSGTFDPTFKPEINDYYTYTIPAGVSSVEVTATTNHPDALASGHVGVIPITGDTDLTITVTAEDGTTKDYIIKVRKEKSTDNKLVSLSVSPGSLNEEFNPDLEDYTVTIPYSQTSITVSGTAAQSALSVEGLREYTDLPVGNKNISVKVTAENGVPRTYRIVVTRLQNDDALLTDLTINGSTIDNFASATDTYNINLDSSYKTITIAGVKSDANATVTGFTNYNLPVGAKEIKIEVTAADGTTKKTYTLNITREADNNTKLANIVVNITGHTMIPSFNATTKTYEVTVPYNYTTFSSSNLTITKAYDEQTVTLDPTININPDTTTEYKIKVDSEENVATDEYILNVKREKSPINKLSSLSVTNNNGVYGSFAPSFTSDTNTYNVTVPVDSTTITIAGTLVDLNSEVTGFGIDLPFSTDVTKTVTVTSELGVDYTYTLNIVKQKSSDATLKNLTASIGTFDKTFNSSTPVYELTVPYGTNAVTLAAEANYQYAQSVTGTGEIIINNAAKEVLITVTAEDGAATKEYVVKIKIAKNTDATLSDLTIDGTTVAGFSSDKEDYSIAVGSKNKTIAIGGTTTDSNATVTDFKNYSLNINENIIVINVTAEDGVTTKAYTLTIDRPADTDTTLSNLSINIAGHTITPSFNSSVKTYEVVVPYNYTVFTAGDLTYTKAYNEQTVTLDPTININPDTTTEYKIKVDSEGNYASDYYTLNVKRAKSTINTLESLVVTTNEGKLASFAPSFKPGTNNYTVSVPTGTTSVEIAGVETDPNSSVTGFTNHNINTDDEILIEVVSETGVKNTYVLTIAREKSSDATLSDLTVTPGALNQIFESSTTYYTVEVPFVVTKVTVAGITNDPNAEIISGAGEYNLGFTERTVQVRVRAEDGTTTKDYTISINRKKNNDALLSDLKVNNVTVTGFDPAVDLYILDDVESTVDSINVSAIVNDNIYASVSGTGNINLTTGTNTIKVTVTAHDGSTKDYRIMVKKLPNNNATLTMIKIDGVPLAGFTPTTTYYEITVPHTKTSVTVVPEYGTGITEVDVSGNTNFVTNGNNYINIEVTAEGGATETYTIKVTREPSTDNTLSFLDVDPGTLSPTFKSDRNNYNVVVGREVDSVQFTYTASYADAQVNVAGPQTLALGANTYLVTVTPESGEINVYSVIVTREKDSNVFLKELKVDGTMVTGFDSATTFYQIEVDTTTTSVNVTAAVESAYSSYQITGPETLSIGLNPYNIKVTAENGSTKTYTLVVNVTQSSNTKLKTLSVSPNDINETFNPTQKDYTVNVDNSVNNVTINATTDDPKARHEINGPYQLTDGENIYTIKVIAEDNSTSTYKVKVIRAAKDEIEVALDSLSVSGYTLKETFNKNLTTYHLTIPNESVTSVVVNATAKTGLNVSVTGQNSLTPGENTINIKVSNGTLEKNYKIIVTIGAETELHQIVSDIHTIDDDYILTVKPEVTALSLKDELLNPNEYLYIYDKDGNEVTSSSSDYIGTGFVVKLIINGTIYDEKAVVVVGDVDGTGTINSIDARGIILHVIEKTTLTGANFEAAYLTSPNGIDTLTSINARSIILHVIGSKLLHI